MKYKHVALMITYDLLRNFTPDIEEVGRQYKTNRRPLTKSEVDRLLKALDGEIERLERRLHASGIDYVPKGFETRR